MDEEMRCGLRHFRCQLETPSLGYDWEDWKRSFNLYMDTKPELPPLKKRSSLLHLGGPELQHVYFNLPDDEVEEPGGAIQENEDVEYLVDENGAPPVNIGIRIRANPNNREGDDEFEKAVKKLDAYFLPKINKAHLCSVFRNIKQEPGERIEKFVLRLRDAGSKCDFQNRIDTEIIHQIIAHGTCQLLRVELMKNQEIKLSEVLRIGSTLEAIEAENKNHGSHYEGQVNRITGSQSQRSSFSQNNNSGRRHDFANANGRRDVSCFNCGRSDHFARDPDCPARGKNCDKCGKEGHFKLKCKGVGNRR